MRKGKFLASKIIRTDQTSSSFGTRMAGLQKKRYSSSDWAVCNHVAVVNRAGWFLER